MPFKWLEKSTCRRFHWVRTLLHPLPILPSLEKKAYICMMHAAAAISPFSQEQRRRGKHISRLSFLFAAPSEFFKASQELWRPIRCTVALYGSLPYELTEFFWRTTSGHFVVKRVFFTSSEESTQRNPAEIVEHINKLCHMRDR